MWDCVVSQGEPRARFLGHLEPCESSEWDQRALYGPWSEGEAGDMAWLG